MGCDIHLHAEVHVEDGGWQHFSHPFIERNYRLFSVLAGVRDASVALRLDWHHGLPSDVTLLTERSYHIDKTNIAPHHVGWIDLDQIKLLQRWYRDEHPDEAHDLDGLIGYPTPNGWSSLPSCGIGDARFVFWFDN